LGQALLRENDLLAKDAQLYAELWTSMASLLRSYTALHGMISKKQLMVEQDAQRILTRCDANWLDLKRDGAVIEWQSADGQSGTMELMETGRLRSGVGYEEHPGEVKQIEEEMDMTAERWARDLMQELPR